MSWTPTRKTDSRGILAGVGDVDAGTGAGDAGDAEAGGTGEAEAGGAGEAEAGALARVAVVTDEGGRPAAASNAARKSSSMEEDSRG